MLRLEQIKDGTVVQLTENPSLVVAVLAVHGSDVTQWCVGNLIDGGKVDWDSPIYIDRLPIGKLAGAAKTVLWCNADITR